MSEQDSKPIQLRVSCSVISESEVMGLLARAKAILKTGVMPKKPKHKIKAGTRKRSSKGGA